jgi:predicted metal-dependent HD superfamily phosphohydrolase
MSSPDGLRERWLALMTGRADAFADLAARYSGPDRHYHNLTHICAVLDVIEAHSREPSLRLAAWLHDVISDPRAGDNEEQSAAYARRLLPGPLADETTRLILLTKTHATAPDDLSGRLLLDADLSILGGEPAEYDAYAAAIRREYAWVPDAEYRLGRAQVLERFLARPLIYQTAMMAVMEEAARANLRREWSALS